MGRGVLSGFFWGSVVSLVVVVTLSLLSPMPQLVASENRRASTPVLRAPAVDNAPDMSATTRDAPAVEAGDGDESVASELSIPAGSEFRRGSAERAPAIPATDESPAAASLAQPESADRPDAPAPDTTPADAPEIAATGIAGLTAPDTAQAPSLNSAEERDAPLVAQPVEPAAPTRETVPMTGEADMPALRAETVTQDTTVAQQTPELAETVAPDSPQAVDSQAAQPIDSTVVPAQTPATAEPAAEGAVTIVQEEDPQAAPQVTASSAAEAPVTASAPVGQATADAVAPAQVASAAQAEPSRQTGAEGVSDRLTDAAAAEVAGSAPTQSVTGDRVAGQAAGQPVNTENRQRIVGSAVVPGTVPRQSPMAEIEVRDRRALLDDNVVQQIPADLPPLPPVVAEAPAPAEARVPQTTEPEADAEDETVVTAQVQIPETPQRQTPRGSAPATVQPAQVPGSTTQPSSDPVQAADSTNTGRPSIIAPDGGNTLPGIRRLPGIGEDEAPTADSADPEATSETANTALARNANEFTNPDSLPLVSVVLVNGSGPRIDPQVLGDLPFPMTVAIDPTDPDAAAIVATYRQAGVEVLMLARGLPTGATAQDVEVTLSAQLSSIPGVIGVMDVPDEGLGQNRDRAAQAVALLQDDGYGLVLYDQGLNSAKQEADRVELPTALIYRSLDGNGEAPDAIARVMDRAAFKAARDGSVLMVGQNVTGTIEGVRKWATGLRARNFALAPASAILTQQ